MAFREIQSSFSLGELDPILISRADFDGYYKGARKLRNALTLPQGGVRRRFGLAYSSTVVDSGDADEPIIDENEVNGIVFDFSPEKRFLIFARPNDRTGTPGVAFEIWLDNALVATVISTNYTIAQIKEIYFLRSQDRILILHDSVAPAQLVRGVNDATWALTTISFNYVPTFDFSTIDGISYRGAGDTFTPSATTGVGITVTSSSAFFTAGHVGGLFLGDGGVFRITAVNAGGTIATGDTVEDFSSTAAIKGVNAFLFGAAWGDFTGGTPAGKNRGFPSRGEFFQNRLALGRTLTLKNLPWLSVSGDFYNFDDSEPLDTNSFALGLSSGNNDEIQDIISSKTLVIIGSTSVYATSMFLDQPITPSNAFMNPQDEKGGADLRARALDNQIFYVDDNLSKVNAGLFDITSNSLVVTDSSLLSAHLISTPVDTAVYKPADNNGTMLMVTNADGSLAILQSLFSQEVLGWTLSTTSGTFEKIFASRENAWALVKRSLNTVATTTGAIDNIYTSNSDFESFTDITAAAQSASNDVGVLENENDYLLIGHDAPYYRIALALNTAASADLDLTFEYLDNVGDWISFTPTDGTTGFTGAGTISWVLDTDTDAWFAQDVRSYLPDGASLPLDSLNGSVKKFWVRIRRIAPGPIDVGMTADTAFTSFTFITDSLSDAALDATLFATDGDYLVIGHPQQFDTLNVALDTNASADISPIFEYLDFNGNWQTFTPTDNTTGFTGNGTITWDASTLASWTRQIVNSQSGKYWIRIQRDLGALVTAPIEDTIVLSIVTTPIEDTIFINSAKRLYIEEVTYDERMDSTEVTTSDANGLVINLDHLVGQQVYALVDDVPEGPFFVSSTGTITVSVASAVVRVGLNYIPEITPMPLISRQFFSQNVYQPKHIKSVYVDYFESLGVTVNGFEIPDLQLNLFTLDQVPVPITDFWEYTPMEGWEPRAEITISQELPLPMTIIGIGYKMETS